MFLSIYFPVAEDSRYNCVAKSCNDPLGSLVKFLITRAALWQTEAWCRAGTMDSIMTLTLFTLPPNKTVKLHICITKLHKCPLSPHVLDCFTFTSPAHCSIVTIAASNTTPDCCLNLRDCYKNSYPNLVLCCRKCPSDGKLHLYYLCSVSPFVLWLASPIFWPILPECQ